MSLNSSDKSPDFQSMTRWQFWIDRGGTFTDIVASAPDGRLLTKKLLSDNPEQYEDAAIAGIRLCMGLVKDEPIPVQKIEVVRMGTTVATNALLEHKGEPVLLLTSRGFADALQIAWQQRPDIFALDIKLPKMLYETVIEADERVRADGYIEKALDSEALKVQLQAAYTKGFRSIAIVFMHAWQYPRHEQLAAKLALETGFTQVSVSHETSALIKFVGRGDTTLADAYLSPVLHRYVERVASQLPGVRLLFMQSNGGLTQADFFQGKDAILSGPAGGVVGMVQTAHQAGFEKLIGFDMGGTSTDVCHYDGDYERTLESQIAGLRIRAPMMSIHTVAAGGSSTLHFDGQRFRVGPDSAGANPGPVAYRREGPLTITDCNVMLGKLQPCLFPAIFGDQANQSLDIENVRQHFMKLAQKPALQHLSPEQIAEGFLDIAVENMANAIKKISLQRGYDVSEYTLCCFGGASGQHACLVAQALGITRIFLHPFAGVLSAYGMGLANIRHIVTQSIEQKLEKQLIAVLLMQQQQLFDQAENIIRPQISSSETIEFITRVHCRYSGADTSLLVDWMPDAHSIREQFERLHQQRFGFISPEKTVFVASIEVEAIAVNMQEPEMAGKLDKTGNNPVAEQGKYSVYIDGQWRQVPFYNRDRLLAGQEIEGPAVIYEQTGTTVLEPGWTAIVDQLNNLIIQFTGEEKNIPCANDLTTRVDPVKLEIFNNLFMSVAEQMGYVLEQTAISVNIKERLDFSCAIFDASGNLVANAPHMPVHLGSMSESIRTVINRNAGRINPGDAFVLNDPYNGGTHLPDITVIKPVFNENVSGIIFYVASRGHHADIGGITPGSIPSHSRTIDEEGILIDNVKLLDKGVFCEQAIHDLLAGGNYPARNIDCNIADLKAQLAACVRGEKELKRVIAQMGLRTVQSYMSHVQDNAEASVRHVIETLHDGSFISEMDDGSRIQVSVSIDSKTRNACFDFTGTSEQHEKNFNAPSAITRAAVLYVMRCLVRDNIPLNEGCLKPVSIIIPEGSMLNPVYPAAVVAGNVETSQVIVNTLLGALKVMGASQGTMNNLTWGNDRYQYYETLCGGAGATPRKKGASAVHTHMTNSRLTDPEILESRYPVVLEKFTVRRGSGGKGKYQGGDGVIRQIRFLENMDVSIVSGHRKIPPFGMNGGGNGMCGENIRISNTGQQEVLDSVTSFSVVSGDSIRIATPGGGAFGKREEEV